MTGLSLLSSEMWGNGWRFCSKYAPTPGVLAFSRSRASLPVQRSYPISEARQPRLAKNYWSLRRTPPKSFRRHSAG